MRYIIFGEYDKGVLSFFETGYYTAEVNWDGTFEQLVAIKDEIKRVNNFKSYGIFSIIPLPKNEATTT